MTARSKAVPALTSSPAYEAATTYSVQLTRPVPVTGGELLPSHKHRIKGGVLATLPADAIGSATALPPSPFDAD